MLEHEIKKKVLTIGNRKGQTVYYAYPKSQQKLTNEMVIERIVRETSLSEGDVSNALISLSNIVCDALKMGMSVDLAELGSLRLIVPSKMMDTPEEVTVADALKTPKIVFTPKQKMRDAANSVELSIDRGKKETASGGTTTDPGSGNEETGIKAAAPHTRPAAASRGFNGVIIFKNYELCTRRDRIRRRLVGGLMLLTVWRGNEKYIILE